MPADTAAVEPKRAEWQALVPLSIGRRGDKDKAADFVPAGEIVRLTEEESAGFLDPARHKTPVIRPASRRNDPMPRITASALFGAKGRPGAPPPEPGSAAPLDVTDESRVIRNPSDPENHPEAKVPEVTDPDADREGATARTGRRRT